ncbi:MAG: hypothetical protein Q4F72_05635 [Desulfovibrionaceae bacterium]|nr:hypothetical protein [Desulfovibrionaceae bacterium]
MMENTLPDQSARVDTTPAPRGTAGLREACLSQLEGVISDAMRLIGSAAGSLSLSDYARSLPGGRPALQDGGDLVEVVRTLAARLYPSSVAKGLERELEDRYLALTANHLGIDYHPEFLQGDFLFAMGCRKVVPVFACGGVPCDNPAFPRGVVLAPRSSETTRPFHLPLFSNARRRALVSVREAYGADDALSALGTYVSRGCLTPIERSIIEGLVRRLYLAPAVLGQRSFRDQMSIANSLLWQKLAAPDLRLPALVSLDLQQVAAELIIRDLAGSGTLIHDLVLEPELTRAVQAELNGARSCWTLREKTGEEEPGLARGSFLFWALDEKKAGLRLMLHPREHSLVCPDRPELKIALEQEGLIQALKEGRLLPSLYLSFAALALARGLSCAGGVFQCAYLPRMAQGTAEALRRCGERARAEHLAGVSPVCTGPLPLRADLPFGGSPGDDCAAGAIDILAGGGIGARLWAALGDISLRDAFQCALSYHYEDLVAPSARLGGWKTALAAPGPGLAV